MSTNNQIQTFRGMLLLMSIAVMICFMSIITNSIKIKNLYETVAVLTEELTACKENQSILSENIVIEEDMGTDVSDVVDDFIEEYDDIEEVVEGEVDTDIVEEDVIEDDTDSSEVVEEEEKEVVDNQKIVFNPDNLSERSNVTVEQLTEMLQGTELCQYSDLFLQKETEYNINALFLVSLSAVQSGWGEDPICEGINNITGVTGWRYYESVDACLEDTCQYLNTEYINEDASLSNLSKKHVEDSETWADTIVTVIEELIG